MLEDYQKGLKDAQHSITLDEGFVKGYLRAAKCQMMLGSPDLSIVWYDKALALQPNNTQAQAEVSYWLGCSLHFWNGQNFVVCISFSQNMLM